MTVALLCGLEGEKLIIQNTPIVVYCGADGIAALRKDIANFSGLISWGTCGGLSSGVKVGDILLGTRIVTEDVSYPCATTWGHDLVIAARDLEKAKGIRWRYAPMLSLSTPASDPAIRASLLKRFGCLAEDEESWVVGELARARGIPCVTVRSPSDGAGQTIPVADLNATNPDGSPKLSSVVSALWQPGGLAAALELAAGYNEALDSLMSFWEIAKFILERG